MKLIYWWWGPKDLISVWILLQGISSNLSLLKPKPHDLFVLWTCYGDCVLCAGGPLFRYRPVFQKTTLCGHLLAFASIFLTFLTFLYHLSWLADLTFPVAAIAVWLWYSDLPHSFNCSLFSLPLSLLEQKQIGNSRFVIFVKNTLYYENQSKQKIRVKVYYSKTEQDLNIHCLVNNMKL